MNIIGISALYHDSACCLLKDGELLSAVQEERFSRIKHDSSIPKEAFKYCLSQNNLTISDIDCLAYYENPQKKLARQLWSGVQPEQLAALIPKKIENIIRETLGYEGEIKFFDHHLSHAASSYYFSGFDSAAVLTVDGVGEWATTTYGFGKGAALNIFEEVNFPDSIGLLYSTITSYLGFEVNEGEYKVMGLAPYGKPSFVDQLSKLIQLKEKGQFQLDMNYFEFVNGNRMYSPMLEELFGRAARVKESKLDQFHMDISKSLQVVLEQVMLNKVTYLYEVTKESNLCMAGGVALNCVANGRILREGPFKDVFVQPASNDAGTALGAAALAHVMLTGEAPTRTKMEHVYFGPSFTNEQVSKMLDATSIKTSDYRHNPDELLTDTAKELADGKIIGWFNGAMEFGPRALGSRSIIANPRDPNMRDKINAVVKKREGFRPFAPAILEAYTSQYFDLQPPSPFMLFICSVTSEEALPAIRHVDNSARVQTVNGDTNKKFAGLITRFLELTGCPMLLNTSFNVRGEPIVCTPEDALMCFVTTDMDCLVLEDFMIKKTENNIKTLQQVVDQYYKSRYNRPRKSISEDMYTFI